MQIQKTSGAFRKVPEVFCTVYSYRNEARALRRLGVRRLGVLACHLVARVLVHAAVVQASQQAAEDSAEEAQRQN